MSDWQVTVVKMLIENGTQGCRQSTLISKTSKYAGDGEVIAYLKMLAAEKKVQKFILPGQVVQWRATTNIEKLE